MAEVEFNIKVTMEERWVNDFCSMLRYMEHCGKVGHSSVVGFYADGDGDFRPKFEIDRPFSYVQGRRNSEKRARLPELEIMFDAG